MSGELYDILGARYVANRRTDPRIAELLWAQLGDAASVLNVGAGTGSYEPPHRQVTAVEPSDAMRARRPPGSPECVAGVAEALPFPDDAFDVSMTVFSDWFWEDQRAGFAEMRRVARERVVVLSFDRSAAEDFWLSREYLPHAHDLWGSFDTTLEHLGECEVIAVPIPGDCVDGFFHAFWQRPHAYLDGSITEAMAVFRRLEEREAKDGLRRLSEDLQSGAWQARHAYLNGRESIDVGYRLLVSTV
ncbi:MAG TPA: class I SAM-dependent methyltransferase [Solirubrobacteraceae bacterium]|nr:class I SAM-dependent methyltransferase [Solirubrobacteraceae bacterium]